MPTTAHFEKTKKEQPEQRLHYLVPSIIGFSHNVTKTIIRKLPQKGKILVGEGDITEPSAIIGVSQVSPGFRVFNLLEILDISADKLSACLIKSSGSKVFKGDVIAEEKKYFGIVSRQFISPIDGIFELLNPNTGQAMIRFMPVSFRLAAGVHGEVIKVVQEKEVHIRTKVDLVEGVLGSGIEREGILRIIATPREVISFINLDKSFMGTVIAGGSLMSKEVIQKALALGVRGIISGGINIRDYKSLVSSLNPLEDVGLSLLATEGYGLSEMPQDVFTLLEKNDNCFVIINPQAKELIIPLLETKDRAKESEREKLCYLKKGMQVRLLSFPYLGREGIVIEVKKEPVYFSSGIEAAAALVEISKETQTVIPIRNLEVISRLT